MLDAVAALKSIPQAALGDLLIEYLEESMHGSWEGFEARDVTGIRRMLVDMVLYGQGRIEFHKVVRGEVKLEDGTK
jgi:hypothetical protein